MVGESVGRFLSPFGPLLFMLSGELQANFVPAPIRKFPIVGQGELLSRKLKISSLRAEISSFTVSQAIFMLTPE